MSNLLSALGVLFAAAALVVSIVALVSSRGWARRSALSSERSSAEAVRSADAAEAAVAEARRSNDAHEAEVASRRANWSAPQHVEGQLYRVRNTGQATAFGALLTLESGAVHPSSTAPRDIEVDDELTFVAIRLGASPSRVRVTWHDADGIEQPPAFREV